MFASYEVLATFGISAVLSFGLSMIILLVVAAKRGFFRIGSKSSIGKPQQVTIAKAQSPLLLTPTAPPLPMVVELAPLKEYP